MTFAVTEKGKKMTEIKLKRRCKYAVDIYPELLEIGLDMEKACDFLNRIKDADVVEVKYGEWSIAIGYDPARKVMCNLCQRMNYEPSNFCPNCGADMRGETNDDRAEN